MNIEPATEAAYLLMQEGCKSLARVEHTGIAIDEDYLDRAITEVGKQIEELKQQLKDDKVWKLIENRFGNNAKLCNAQIGKVAFDELGFSHSGATTVKGQSKYDAEVLAEVDHPFVKDYLRLAKLEKMRGTYLHGLKEEVVDGRVHPSFNLHTAITFRGSESNPNLQNVPIRDPEVGRIVRSCFVPTKGNVFIEMDFGAHEFRLAAAVWGDPKMISYASDPNKDIHRDKAMECYKLTKEQVNKDSRYVAKNSFVFPELYGSYYVQIARNMWNGIDEKKLRVGKGEDGTPMRDHLKSVEIRKLGECDPKQKAVRGTFEYHIKEVEDRFKQEFIVFKEATDKWWNEYLQRGWFRVKTGFVLRGLYSKNFLLNAPVQSVAFHCLLWSLIELEKRMRKNRMRSKIVNTIHDCILVDCPPDEIQDVLAMLVQIMTIDLPNEWKWIVVPLAAEADVTDVDGNWWDKHSWIENSNGVWGPK